jgi:hypothetical protein
MALAEASPSRRRTRNSTETQRGNSEMTVVTFYSPGTFVAEYREIHTLMTDPNEIKLLGQEIVERHGAKPHSFTIEGDPKTYWFGKNKVIAYADIPDTKENEVLRWNMQFNQWSHIIENSNSWKFTAPYNPEKDVILE